MSLASRLAAADRQIERDPFAGAGQLGLNSAGVPGGVGTVVLPGPVRAGGLLWTPEDGLPHAASIGAALALETSQGRVDAMLSPDVVAAADRVVVS